jgi:hypothetical protein
MNMVKFGVITKVCKGYAFARVMDNAGTVTAKEVFLGYRQFVVVDESQAQPWLTDMIDEVTEPKNGDYVAFLYNIHPVHRGGATPAYKWGIISNHDSASSSEGYTGPLMETDSLESGPIDPEIDRLARSTCGQNGVRHHRPDENPAFLGLAWYFLYHLYRHSSDDVHCGRILPLAVVTVLVIL